MQSSLLGAIERRSALLSPLLATPKPKQALRIYDGYREGGGRFVADVFGTTLVLFDHASEEEAKDGAALALGKEAMERLPFIDTVITKEKSSRDPERRRGTVVLGEAKDVCRSIVEDGVRYAVRLLAHHDSTFYLDTRGLRRFVRERAEGKTVLNAFAYTGSLGIAATAGRARRVVQTDKNREFLTIAKDSCSLNGFPIDKASFVAADFFGSWWGWSGTAPAGQAVHTNVWAGAFNTLVLLTSSLCAPILDYLPGVRKGIVADLPRRSLPIARYRDLASRLKAEQYGTALVMPRTWKSALAPFLAGIPERTGFAVCQEARRHGVWVRPLGDVVVLMPPLAIGDDDLAQLTGVVSDAIRTVVQ